MAGPTTIAFGDANAQKKWSGSLFIDTTKKSYFDRKFVSTVDNAVIQRLTDLESDAGGTIDYDRSCSSLHDVLYCKRFWLSYAPQSTDAGHPNMRQISGIALLFVLGTIRSVVKKSGW
jgi:hypothetical protein